MPSLILIKHASPQVEPQTPSEQWNLSERGRASCGPLAEAIRPQMPSIIITSTEAKAIETGTLVAAQLNIPCETGQDLFEHNRSNVPHMRTSEFISMVELFFRRPDELVLGEETADEAEDRFTRAVQHVIEQHADQNIAIVSHGTVIALLLARHTARTGFQLWRELSLPSFAVLDTPSLEVREIIARIG